jgi:hypothetical protein
MKRIFCLSLILFFYGNLPLFSQTYIGAVAGVNSTSLSGDAPEDAEYSSRLGYNGGIMADFTLREDIILSIQLRYVQKGTTISYDVGEYELRDSLAIGMSYFSIPVMVKINSANKRTFFSSGIDLSYLTGATLENLMEGSSKDVDHLLKKYDFAVTFGFGVNFPVKTSLVSLELRYLQSLTNLSDISSGETEEVFPYRFRISGFQFCTSILFSI